MGYHGYPQKRHNGGIALAHRLRAEKALGRPLPPGAEVHHVDGTKRITSPLVICQDGAYHKLLHMRARIMAAGGNPNTDHVCGACRQVKPRELFSKRRKRVTGCDHRCLSCKNKDTNARRAAKRLQACA